MNSIMNEYLGIIVEAKSYKCSWLRFDRVIRKLALDMQDYSIKYN